MTCATHTMSDSTSVPPSVSPAAAEVTASATTAAVEDTTSSTPATTTAAQVTSRSTPAPAEVTTNSTSAPVPIFNPLNPLHRVHAKRSVTTAQLQATLDYDCCAAPCKLNCTASVQERRQAVIASLCDYPASALDPFPKVDEPPAGEKSAPPMPVMTERGQRAGNIKYHLIDFCSRDTVHS
jgi:hypothetical protein